MISCYLSTNSNIDLATRFLYFQNLTVKTRHHGLSTAQNFLHNSFISYHVSHNPYPEPLPTECLFPRGSCSYLTIPYYETEKNPSWFLVYFLTRKKIHLFEWTEQIRILYLCTLTLQTTGSKRGNIFFLNFTGNLYPWHWILPSFSGKW